MSTEVCYGAAWQLEEILEIEWFPGNTQPHILVQEMRVFVHVCYSNGRLLCFADSAEPEAPKPLDLLAKLKISSVVSERKSADEVPL